MDKQLRMTAGAIVVSSKLSKSAKLQLLNFIESEATDVQIKALLLDGEILTDIDEQTEEIIEDRFKLSEIGMHQGFGGTYMRLSQGEAEIASIAAALAIGYMAFKLAAKITTKKECKDFKYGSQPWIECQRRVKIKKLQTQIDFMKSKSKLCDNTKKPDKCRKKLKEKMNKLTLKIKEIQLRSKQK